MGSDISEPALGQARALTFHPETLRRVPEPLRQRYFQQGPKGFALQRRLASRATFCRHNLMDRPYPLPAGAERFDVIFCRNVLIYFTDVAFDFVVATLSEQLVPDGVLVLSAAEPILRVQPLLSTIRCSQAFFYKRRKPGSAAEMAGAPVTDPAGAPAPRRSAVAPLPLADSVPLLTPPGGESSITPEDPREEAVRNFQLVLDWAAAGEPDVQTEQGLRRCLYLDPHFAQARYLLGMLLEQRGARPEASGEYRRALATLNEGRSRPTPFFLNDERLKVACAQAMKRLAAGSGGGVPVR
jgi:chemotaxis protein methyltransferase CheR